MVNFDSWNNYYHKIYLQMTIEIALTFSVQWTSFWCPDPVFTSEILWIPIPHTRGGKSGRN